MQRHTDHRLLGLMIANGVGADAMPPSESLMVCSSSQSASSAESGNDSVKSLCTSYHYIRKMTGYSNIMRQELGDNHNIQLLSLIGGVGG